MTTDTKTRQTADETLEELAARTNEAIALDAKMATEDFDFRDIAAQRNQPSDAVKKLRATAVTINETPSHVVSPLDPDVEMSLLKYATTMRENDDLKATIASLEETILANDRSYAAESVRLNDQIAFLTAGLASAEATRDAAIKEATEVRTRCDSLVKATARNSATLKDSLSSSIDLIVKSIEHEMGRVAVSIRTGSEATSAMISEVLDVGKGT